MNQMISYRVVAIVAGNSDAVTLTGLKADTQYQLTVAAVWQGRKYKSRPIVFRTLGESKMTKYRSKYHIFFSKTTYVTSNFQFPPFLMKR